MEVINALGRRKSAVARVYVTTGKATSPSTAEPLKSISRRKLSVIS